MATPADTAPAPPAGWREAALLPALVMVSAIVSVVSSLGAPLLPTIAQADHVTLSSAQWLLTGALLAGALSTPVMGRLADGPAQRQVVVFAMGTTVVGCVLAAATDSFPLAVAGRILQGVGLGILPVTMAIARRHIPSRHVGRAVGTLSIAASVGIGLGYPITSLVAEVFDYHAAFWFGAITVACGLVLAWVVLPARSDVPARRLDRIGVAALSLAVVALSVVLSEGAAWHWLSAPTFGTFAVFAVSLAVWIRHELRFPDPLVDLRQVRHRSVLTADVSGFVMCVAMYLFIPVAVEFVQIPKSSGYGFGSSVLVSGLVLVPMSAGTFTASRFLPGLERRFGPRGLLPVGSVVFAASMTFLAVEHRALWEVFVAVGIAGLAMGITFAAMPGFIVRAVPVRETGSAMGFYQVLRSVGLSTGSAVSALVLAAYTHEGHTYPQVGGFRTALLIASGMCLLTAVLSYVLPGRRLVAINVAPALEVEEGELAGAAVMLDGDPEELTWDHVEPVEPVESDGGSRR